MYFKKVADAKGYAMSHYKTGAKKNTLVVLDIFLPLSRGVPEQAEIIPLEPDSGNADVGRDNPPYSVFPQNFIKGVP